MNSKKDEANHIKYKYHDFDMENYKAFEREKLVNRDYNEFQDHNFRNVRRV